MADIFPLHIFISYNQTHWWFSFRTLINKIIIKYPPYKYLSCARILEVTVLHVSDLDPSDLDPNNY